MKCYIAQYEFSEMGMKWGYRISDLFKGEKGLVDCEFFSDNGERRGLVDFVFFV